MRLVEAYLFSGIPKERLFFFTKQMSVMLGAGVSLLSALQTLLDQEPNAKSRDVIDHLIRDIRNGLPLSEALRHFPEIFNKTYISIVTSGEMGVGLASAFNLISIYQEKHRITLRKIRSAMLYPCILFMFSVLVVLCMVFLVIPRFEIMYSQLLQSSELPVLTRGIIDCSRFMVDHCFEGILSILFLIFLLYGLWSISFIRRYVDFYKLFFPVWGHLVKTQQLALYLRTLSCLLSASVDLLDAMKLSRNLLSNSYLFESLNRIELKLIEGESLSLAMRQESVFPETIVTIVKVGEETGCLNNRLIELSDQFDEDSDYYIKHLVSLFEPLVVLCIAVFVALIVLAMFLPIVGIIEQLS